VTIFYIVWLAVAAGLVLGGLAVRVIAGAEAPAGRARLLIRTGAYGFLLAAVGLVAYIAHHK
jgi:hypothetical protein